MKKYNRIMLGRGSKFASMCREEGYIGANFEIFQDLTGHLPENWRDFNAEFIPIYMKNVPGKSKTAAGLACGFLWTIAKGLKIVMSFFPQQVAAHIMLGQSPAITTMLLVQNYHIAAR